MYKSKSQHYRSKPVLARGGRGTRVDVRFNEPYTIAISGAQMWSQNQGLNLPINKAVQVEAGGSHSLAAGPNPGGARSPAAPAPALPASTTPAPAPVPSPEPISPEADMVAGVDGPNMDKPFTIDHGCVGVRSLGHGRVNGYLLLDPNSRTFTKVGCWRPHASTMAPWCGADALRQWKKRSPIISPPSSRCTLRSFTMTSKSRI